MQLIQPNRRLLWRVSRIFPEMELALHLSLGFRRKALAEMVERRGDAQAVQFADGEDRFVNFFARDEAARDLFESVET